jgi:hypothetical protein
MVPSEITLTLDQYVSEQPIEFGAMEENISRSSVAGKPPPIFATGALSRPETLTILCRAGQVFHFVMPPSFEDGDCVIHDFRVVQRARQNSAEIK